MDLPLSSPSTASPLFASNPAPTSPATIDASPLSTVASPTPFVSSASGGGEDGHAIVLLDESGSSYTTTVYSTRAPPSTLNSTPADIHQTRQTTPNFVAIFAGVGGGAGLLLLSIGVIWHIWARRAKRRARISLIKDRKFYPDRYNQTVTSKRHSELNKSEPDLAAVQPPPPHPPPSLLPRHPSTLSSGLLSRQTSSYQNHIPSSGFRGNWAGAPRTEGILEDVPLLARHRIPYPSSPAQILLDRYTMLPSQSASSSNSPALRLALNPPPQHPHTSRSSSATHRRYHSDQIYYNRPQCQRHHDSYSAPVPTPYLSSPAPTRMGRRYTVFASPPTSPTSFSTLSSPYGDHPAAGAQVSPVALRSHARPTSSSTDPPVECGARTTIMMCTNPDLDTDPETETEPEGEEPGSGRGSPSATDIIRLYGKDQDTSTSSVLTENGPPSVSTNTTSVSTKNG